MSGALNLRREEEFALVPRSEVAQLPVPEILAAKIPEILAPCFRIKLSRPAGLGEGEEDDHEVASDSLLGLVGPRSSLPPI